MITAAPATHTERFALDGELDLAAVPTLRAAFTRAMQGSPQRVRVDLSGATFLDAAGLSALLSWVLRVRSAGVDCAVVTPSEPVLRLLRLTRTEGVFAPSL